MKILIIEDEKELGLSAVEYLQKEGFLCELADDFDSAHEKVHMYKYDCVVVDITLPGGSGLNIIRELKKIGSETGIIIISAKNAVEDRISGLDIGADDYLTKPFYLPELSARIRSIIRRKNFQGKKELVVGEITIIPDSAEVKVCGQVITLTRKEYELLHFFISNKNMILTKESIAEHLWGDEMDMADSFDFVYTHIKNLRKKIMEKSNIDYINTVYGMGYKFIAP
ncbi:MAG: response regulator transcription factor [Bacteroidota bacterium]